MVTRDKLLLIIAISTGVTNIFLVANVFRHWG